MSMNAVASGPPAGNGGPPSNYELDRRLTVLETRFDTILPTLATKQDLQALRAEMQFLFSEHKAYLEVEMGKLRGELLNTLNGTLKWMMAVAATLFIGMFAINYAMWNTVKSALESSQRTTVAPQQSTVPAPSAPPSTSLRVPAQPIAD